MQLQNQGVFIMTKYDFKCPDCGCTHIKLNTNTDVGFEFQCTACGRKGNRKLFSIDSKGSNYDWEDYGDFET